MVFKNLSIAARLENGALICYDTSGLYAGCAAFINRVKRLCSGPKSAAGRTLRKRRKIHLYDLKRKIFPNLLKTEVVYA